MQTFFEISESILKKLQDSGEQSTEIAFKKAIQDPSYKQLAFKIRAWEITYVNTNLIMKSRLSHELLLLGHYFKVKV